ncbi:putative phage protein (For DNA packaging) [Candidatus Desulfosporosinus infrequens]|uniref:Putative phage protein (For DNA packaging) n=1 Tax=Candidatus Desulfosporosinus infrequens TaxID=2043169 RepID=A0A2U3LBM4_9FIRM|nr:putative phage protein (For DNA packaging) [Candidatus Desulfosporosinus infrequens]
MALIDDVRAYLRIDASDTSFDVEIQDLINAVQTELTDVGVNSTLVGAATDPLIKKAITTYCKANFGYDTDNAEAFASSYEKLKIYLMNSGTYQAVSTS